MENNFLDVPAALHSHSSDSSLRRWYSAAGVNAPANLWSVRRRDPYPQRYVCPPLPGWHNCSPALSEGRTIDKMKTEPFHKGSFAQRPPTTACRTQQYICAPSDSAPNL